MIVRMKKITLFVAENERDNFLLALRKLGVLHIRESCPALPEHVQRLEQDYALFKKAADVISAHCGSGMQLSLSYEDAKQKAREIIEFDREYRMLDNELSDLQTQLLWFAPWGDFNPQEIVSLRSSGIYVRLFHLTKQQWKKAKAGSLQVIRTVKNSVFAVSLSLHTEADFEYDEVLLPKRSADELRYLQHVLRAKKTKLETSLKEQGCLQKIFSIHLRTLGEKLKFLTVKHTMQQEGVFSYLEGFCPVSGLKNLVAEAKGFHAGYLIEDPGSPEEVPTLVENPPWIRIIDPVFRFMNTVPGYQEFDISFWFLVFFSLFFAMIVGDGGYGLLFLFLTFFIHRKVRNAPPEPFFLLYLLSCSTIIWGAVTGTWFGFEQIARLPFFKVLIIDKLYSFSELSQNFVIYFCFVIGVVHLSIAHLLLALRVINSKGALAEAGWISILWGMFFLAGTLILNNPFPVFGKYFFIVGIALVLLFSSPEKNILKAIAASLIDAPLKIISSFGDIVSYLRLFAVGTASVIVASTFNNMGLSAGFGTVLSGLGAACILFLGHALNIALACMAVIVHGIRLNMLEFSGHLGMQWSGKSYLPFKEEENQESLNRGG